MSQSPIPHDPEAERAILAACIADPEETIRICCEHGVTDRDFFTLGNQLLFVAVVNAHRKGAVTFNAIFGELAGELAPIGGPETIQELTAQVVEPRATPGYCRVLKRATLRRRQYEIAEEGQRRALDPTLDPVAEMQLFHGEVEKALRAEGSRASRSMLRKLKFDSANPPPEAVPVFTIDGQNAGSAGNLQGIQGPVKSGKSSLQGAMFAACFNPGQEYLGIVASDGPGSLLHFDCEQSRSDHHKLVTRSLRRAGLEREPSWFHSYAVKDMTTQERREAFFAELAALGEDGPIKVAFIDLCDIITDPNDAAESFGIIERLHIAAGRFNVPIYCTIHENPGDGGKPRGHVGSQLLRKAETNLRLSKDASGVITLYSEASRNCNIPKEHGPRFTWDFEHGMHVRVESARKTKDDAKREERIETLDECFRDAQPGGMQRVELLGKIAEVDGCKIGTARDHFDQMREMQLIMKTATGMWRRKS